MPAQVDDYYNEFNLEKLDELADNEIILPIHLNELINFHKVCVVIYTNALNVYTCSLLSGSGIVACWAWCYTHLYSH